MDTASLSISPTELATRLAGAGAPLVLDVRREVRYAEADSVLPQAQRCDPDHVPGYAASQPAREVVVYCVHGLEVGKQAAADLRAKGWNARFLEGGIEGWKDQGFPTERKGTGA